MREMLEKAGNLIDIEPNSRFGIIGSTMVEQANEDDYEFVAAIKAGKYGRAVWPCADKIMDQFDQTISKYQLNYPIRYSPNPSVSSTPSTSTSITTARASAAPSWVWDMHRNAYYRYDTVSHNYIYANGLVLDTNFQPVSGTSGTIGAAGQLAITNGSGADEEVN